MQSLAEKIEKLKQETAQKIEKLTREHEALEFFTSKTPSLTPDIFETSERGEIWATYKAETLTDAQKIIKSLNVSPLVITRGTFTSFMPLSKFQALPDEKKEKLDEIEIFPYWFHFDQFKGVTLKFFTSSTDSSHGPALVKIELGFGKTLKAFNHTWKTNRRKGNEVEDVELAIQNDFYTIDEEASFTSRRVRWFRGGSEYANDFSLYFEANGHDYLEKMNLHNMIVNYLERMK